jgi:hypothetical protein
MAGRFGAEGRRGTRDMVALLITLFLLLYGADWFVDGAGELARALGLSLRFFLGFLLCVAFVLCLAGFSPRFFVGVGRLHSSDGESCARASWSCPKRLIWCWM